MNGRLRGLIVYGTSFGATKGTSEEIARILREENIDVDVVDAQEKKVRDISDYKLVIVGSSLANCRWNSGAEDFLKKLHGELELKGLALFVSSLKPIAEREGNAEEVARYVKLPLRTRYRSMASSP
jgi:menaquinone-dependent protoporphyrinogen IX oxidase